MTFQKFQYPQEEEVICPVYSGNKVRPAQTKTAPEVSFDHKFALSYTDKPEENTLWTLILTNPDGNLTNSDKEYVHWMM